MKIKSDNLMVKYNIELLKKIWLFLLKRPGVRRCTQCSAHTWPMLGGLEGSKIDIRKIKA